MDFSTKSFLRFLTGFLSMILFALGAIFVTGFYQVEILGKGKEIATPASNKGSVEVALKEGSKTTKAFFR